MKKLNKLILNDLSNKELSHKAMSQIIGGRTTICTCGCCYKDQGGSGDDDNMMANCTTPPLGLLTYCPGDPWLLFCEV